VNEEALARWGLWLQHKNSYMRENQQMHQLVFNLLVMYGGSYMFRHYIAILRERS
jgi:hypothetical protein